MKIMELYEALNYLESNLEQDINTGKNCYYFLKYLIVNLRDL